MSLVDHSDNRLITMIYKEHSNSSHFGVIARNRIVYYEYDLRITNTNLIQHPNSNLITIS